MKPVHMLIGLFTILPGAAFAQDAEKRAFDGVHVGVSIDRRTLDGDYKVPNFDTKLDESKSGIGYRGHVGYDLRFGAAFVIGAEGGLGRGGRSLGMKGDVADYSLKPGWNYDVSGRVGVLPTSNIMLYGRGGYSWLSFDEKTDFRDVKRLDIESSGTKKGLLLGAGVEAAVTSGVRARAEYNQTNYGEGLKSSKVQLGLTLGF
jgi:outer membrane immunogenic protein